MSNRFVPPADQCVTASDLVRHFGVWQERAARAPVYILHRGRPRFVIASVDTLAAPPPHANAVPLDVATMLDGVSDLVLVADADGAICASSRAARAHFETLAATGAPIAAITPAVTRAFLADAIARIRGSGVGDRFELPSAARDGRVLTLAIEPSGTGIVVFGRDGTAEHDSARARAAERAFDDAMAATGHVATATINPRGYVVDPAPALVALTGLARDALATIRFAALVELGSRVALGEAIEAAMAGGTPRPIAAMLLVNRADPVPVRIGLSAIRTGSARDGVAAVIVVRAAA